MDATFELVESVSDLQRFFQWLEQDRSWLAVDTETGGLDWWRNDLRMVQVGDRDAGWSLPFDWFKGPIREALNNYRRSPVVMHNCKFDIHFLEHNGVTIDRGLIHDTRAMAHIIEPHLPSGLKPASTRFVHSSAAWGDKELKLVMFKNGWDWDTIPVTVPQYWMYAALDVVLTARLAETLWPVIDARFKEVYNTEVQTAITLVDMERRGITIDTEFCRHWSGELSNYERQMEQYLEDAFGIKNPGSTQQIAQSLMDQGLSLKERTPSGKYKMDAATLGSIRHPIAEAVLSYRDAVKTRSTYLDGFQSFAHEGLLHCSINPLGAKTGRMSASRPNLQNVPRSWVRSAFVPRPGNKLVLVDYDQIELRLMAHYAGDEALINAVKGGDDLHAFVGRMVYNTPTITPEQRRVVKAANFAKIYGAGAQKFADTAGISIDEARRFNKLYDSRFPAVTNWIRRTSMIGDSEGSITTPFIGRQQVVGGKEGGYKLVNYFIQGTAADVLKRAIVQLSMTDADQYMLIPIHDEVAFDVPAELVEDVTREITTVMEDTVSFSVPLSVGSDVVDRWGDKYAA